MGARPADMARKMAGWAGQGWGLQRAGWQGGTLTAKVALHPPPVSIELLISILTTQLIRLHVPNYDRVCLWGWGHTISPHPQAPQEARFIDQKRHIQRSGLGSGVGCGVRGEKGDDVPSFLSSPPRSVEVSPPQSTSGLQVST